jgi:phenylalanine-4-hydroxylase
LYAKVRDLRHKKEPQVNLTQVFEQVKQNHTEDWLLSVEILELSIVQKNQSLENIVISYLEDLIVKRPEVAHLIKGGMDLLLNKD